MNALLQPVGGRQMRLDEMWGQGGQVGQAAGRNGRPAAPAPAQPSPAMIQVCAV